MTRITAFARSQVAAALTDTAGVPVLQTMPGTPRPPCILLGESDPFVEPAQEDAPGAYTIRFDALALVEDRPGDRDTQLADLDALTDRCLAGLAELAPVTVSTYRPVTLASGQSYMSATLQIALTIQYRKD